jgi:hypothetical protein
VVSSRKLRYALRAQISEHFELILTTAGVLFAVVLTFAQLDRGTQGLALTFLVWLQGFLIWAVRRHSRLARARLIRKLRVMLQDRVNNQLTVLVGLTDIHTDKPAAGSQDDTEVALTAARAVSREIETLSIETLRSWEARYSEHYPTALR